MIPLLFIGGITAALALLAKRTPAAAAATVAPASSPPIGSAVTPTPSTPPALFTTPENFPYGSERTQALYQTAVAARMEMGIPIQSEQQPAARTAAPAYVLPGSTPPRIAPVAPAPARAPIVRVGAGGYGPGSRAKFSLL